MPKSARLQDELAERTRKSRILMGVVAAAFVALFLRLFFLQVVDADKNIRLSRENQMRLNIIKAPRGLIYDRNGVMLARNRPSYSISILPYKTERSIDIFKRLMSVRDSLGRPVFDSVDLSLRLTRAKWRRFEETRLKDDVSMDVVSVIEEHSDDLPGVYVQTESRREYPMGSKTFHALGYMSEINDDQIDSLSKFGYMYGDQIGRAGVEEQYEKTLKGVDGREYIEINAYGRNIGNVPNTPRIDPKPGNDIYLAIDSKMQEIAARDFGDSLRGGLVAIDPRNGEVLCMYSSPSLDPNIFSLAPNIRSKEWAKVALDPRLPLNNRVTTGVYPPGSTFKLVTALSGLASGRVKPDEHMPRSCTGSFAFGSRIAHCWKKDGHGYTNVYEAIRSSCNVYFYQVGLRVGDSLINFYADRVGFGHQTGIDLPSERSGWLSGEAQYNEKYAKRGWTWTGGMVLDLAIGQAQLVTPIQEAVMVGGLGTGDIVYTPHVFKEERDRNGTVINQFKPVISRHVGLNQYLRDCLHKGMAEVVNEPGGTGGRARVPFLTVGGKTGSSQNPFSDKTHALFVGCAPLDKPVIAIACVVEEAGHGGSVAAPIAGDVMRYFFSRTPEGRMLTESSARADGKEQELAAYWAQIDSVIKAERNPVVPDSTKVQPTVATAKSAPAVKPKGSGR